MSMWKEKRQPVDRYDLEAARHMSRDVSDEVTSRSVTCLFYVPQYAQGQVRKKGEERQDGQRSSRGKRCRNG